MTELNLSLNNIGDSRATGLADALKQINRTLTDLNLSSNNVCEAGAESLANALVNNRILFVNLYGNSRIGKNACTLLSKLVPAGRVTLPSPDQRVLKVAQPSH